MARYAYQPFSYQKPPELLGDDAKTYPVAIIGAGPIGLSMAIDLALKGSSSVVLDDNNVVSVGSRAICWAKRSLEIFDRLGVGKRMLKKGVTWQVGRLFHGKDEVYSFDLLPEEGHTYPAFINLQQYYVEQYLVERALQFPDLIDLRFKNKVIDHRDDGNQVMIDIETPDGNYSLNAEYMIACDGARSPTRQRMKLPFEGQTFEEKFLIVDVEMKDNPFGENRPAERWFWFEPDFHKGQSALLHKQPDDIYRIDFQLPADADEAEEKKEENIARRLKAMVGNKPFTLDWMSIYRFTCAKLDKFVHNRVIFVGDSAHVVSPFGARGGNGGVHDVDNLGWKLAAVLKGTADVSLLETYDRERQYGAEENIANSARATNFMTPKSPIEKMFRDEVLRLSRHLPFARRLINSGRLSVPCSLQGLVPDTGSDIAPLLPGQAAVDAPLLGQTGPTSIIQVMKNEFVLLSFGQRPAIAECGIPHLFVGKGLATIRAEDFNDFSGLASKRYGENITYLFRPDGHVAASFRDPNPDKINAAIASNLCGYGKGIE